MMMSWFEYRKASDSSPLLIEMIIFTRYESVHIIMVCSVVGP
jgi:hypothetical protein